MNSTLDKIKTSRPDLSDYLYHFTKGANAKDSLMNIIFDEKIKDVGNKGVICFTESPVYNLVEMFDIFNKYQNPMFAPYGIAIPKQKLFKSGGRPVIYGPNSERKFIDQSILWRYEDFDDKKDFTWLREWRINSSEVNLDPTSCFVITKTKQEELESLFYPGDYVCDGDWADGQWWDQSYMSMNREWKSISLETIVNESIQNNSKLISEISSQKLGEEA